jgi:hypothetical protein
MFGDAAAQDSAPIMRDHEEADSMPKVSAGQQEQAEPVTRNRDHRSFQGHLRAFCTTKSYVEKCLAIGAPV